MFLALITSKAPLRNPFELLGPTKMAVRPPAPFAPKMQNERERGHRGRSSVLLIGNGEEGEGTSLLSVFMCALCSYFHKSVRAFFRTFHT